MKQDMELTGSESPLDCGVARVVPDTALVLSRIESADGRTLLVAQHDIHDTPQGWALGSADVLDPKGVTDIVRRLDSEAAARSGPQFLPPNILAQSDDELIWHVPGAIGPMFFLVRGEGRTTKLDVTWPSLVFHARGGSLRLFATATGQRPEPSTWLFEAPLMNHNAESGLCFGSIPRPQRADLSSMATYEAAVFQTNFTHVWGELPIVRRQGKGDASTSTEVMLDFYKTLAERGAKRFPKAALRDAGLTLGDLIAQAG